MRSFLTASQSGSGELIALLDSVAPGVLLELESWPFDCCDFDRQAALREKGDKREVIEISSDSRFERLLFLLAVF